MNGRDLPDQGQAYAAAMPLGGVKGHKDFFALIRGNAGTIIGYGNDGAAGRVLYRRQGDPPGWLVAQRIHGVAHQLGISPRTVEIHRASIMEKLHARNLSNVVRTALAASWEVH